MAASGVVSFFNENRPCMAATIAVASSNEIPKEDARGLPMKVYPLSTVRNTTYIRWLAVSLIVAIVDVIVLSIADNPKGTGVLDLVQAAMLMLLSPVLVVKIYFLSLAQIICHKSLIGTGCVFGGFTANLIWGLSDIPVCLLYLSIMKLMLRGWHWVKKN